MIKKIPQNIIPEQLNLNDTLGDLWATWNIDLTSDLGQIKVSPRTNTKITSATSGFGTPVAFARNVSSSISVDTMFCVCPQAIFAAPVSSMIFAKDAFASSPTTELSNLYSDATIFNGYLVVSLLTNVARLVSGTWTVDWLTTTIGAAALDTGVPHPLCVSFNNLLLIGNDNEVVSVDITGTYNNTAIILPLDYKVNWIESSDNTVWIGARNRYGGMGKVFSWDGYSDNYNSDYKVGSDNTYSCVIKDEVPYTLNSLGQLLAFSGSGFPEIARLPVYNDNIRKFTPGAIDYFTMNRNGMSLVNGKINMLVNSGIDGNVYELLENQVSGIWEYTPETGLYHKNSIVFSDSASIPTFGSPMINQAGALYGIDKEDGGYLAGASLYSDDGDTGISVMNRLGSDTDNKMGYFITPKIYTDTVDEEWQKIYLGFEKMLNSGDSITIKYRTSVGYIDSSGFTQVGTWASATTFTTTATEFSAVSEGDELEVISGEGAGLSTTITDISEVGGTYTCTIDFTLTNASGEFRFRTSNWTKIEAISDLVQTWKDLAVGTNSNWIQFKVLLYGKGKSPIINKLIIQSKPQISIT